jgi:hypothetical protein
MHQLPTKTLPLLWHHLHLKKGRQMTSSCSQPLRVPLHPDIAPRKPKSALWASTSKCLTKYEVSFHTISPMRNINAIKQSTLTLSYIPFPLLLTISVSIPSLFPTSSFTFLRHPKTYSTSSLHISYLIIHENTL